MTDFSGLQVPNPGVLGLAYEPEDRIEQSFAIATSFLAQWLKQAIPLKIALD
jgi:hypothetical protein